MLNLGSFPFVILKFSARILFALSNVRAIILQNDLLCNGTDSVTGGYILEVPGVLFLLPNHSGGGGGGEEVKLILPNHSGRIDFTSPPPPPPPPRYYFQIVMYYYYTTTQHLQLKAAGSET